jgi:hypothetical protein
MQKLFLVTLMAALSSLWFLRDVFWPSAKDPYRDLPPIDGFDFPVGPPDAQGYYDAQAFRENDHLGEDWNGVGGGDSDLGDPVFSAAAGVVSFAEDIGGGWGNVVRVTHRLPEGGAVETLYAHLDAIAVKPGQELRRGQKLGTIGTAHGKYLAHLHFEVRERPGLPIGPGYSDDASGYLEPTVFVRAHRPGGR